MVNSTTWRGLHLHKNGARHFPLNAKKTPYGVFFLYLHVKSFLTLRADCGVLPFLVRELDDSAAGGTFSVSRGLTVAELIALECEPIFHRTPQLQKRLVLTASCRVIL